MRRSNCKHRDRSFHLPSTTTTKQPILKRGCLFLCWFGWYCLTPSNNIIEKDGRNERGHLPTGTVTTNIKLPLPTLPAILPCVTKTGFRKTEGPTTMMSTINFEKKDLDA
ncbi:hypothetical protein DINM_005195 [Dirofilaria immitis]|nr:hypothetical protein [Dirofilaria immitis]